MAVVGVEHAMTSEDISQPRANATRQTRPSTFPNLGTRAQPCINPALHSWGTIFTVGVLGYRKPQQ